MIILTQGTTNNVFYSTNYGITFTAMTVGSAPMTSCAISYDGFEITVSNASNVYTLNRNTQGYAITMGNQSGLTNQGYNSVAIGNLAGVTNQSANSIILNASGSTLDAYNPGFFVSPVQSQLTANQSSAALLGYGTDNQIVQTGSYVFANGNVGIGAAYGAAYSSDRLTIYGPIGYTPSAGYAAISLYNGYGGQNVTGSDALCTQITMGPYGPYLQARYVNTAYVDSMRLDICTSTGSNNASPVPRISVLSGLQSGYVGIGTTAPIALLHITGSATVGDRNGSLRVSTQRAGLYLSSLGAGGTDWNIWTTLTGESPGAGALAIYDQTNAAFRMVISNSGNVGIGIINPSNKLHVQGNVTVGGPNCSIYWAGSSDNYIFTTATDGFGAGSGTNNFVISSWYGLGFGNASNGNYATAYINCRTGTYYGVSALSSDKRMKKNIQPSTNCLDKINSIPVVSYDFIESHKPHVQYGIVAQDVRDIVPEAVSITSNFIGDSDKIVTHILDGDIITITSPSHGYHTGNVLRFTIDYVNTIDDKFHTTSIMVIDDDTYTIPTWNEYDSSASLYVYGKFVNDFHNVDASHFTFLALGGVKELIAENTQLKSQLASQASAIEAQNSALAALEARLAALEGK